MVEAMQFWADLTDEVRKLLEAGDHVGAGRLMNANFDRRTTIYELSEGNLRLVRIARELGVCAKFSGSGGAIVGFCPDEKTFKRLQQKFATYDVNVIRPEII